MPFIKKFNGFLGQSNLPLGDPKVFVYTESEISPVTVRSTSNSSKKNAANTHRRKVLANSSSVSPSYSRSSMETDIFIVNGQFCTKSVEPSSSNWLIATFYLWRLLVVDFFLLNHHSSDEKLIIIYELDTCKVME